MADADIRTETALAAPPGLDDDALLSGLIQLSAAMARAFQADAIAALQADDLDRAGKAEVHFSRLFLGIRRAIALRAKLRQQQEEARRAADQDRDDQVAQATVAAASPRASPAPSRPRPPVPRPPKTIPRPVNS